MDVSQPPLCVLLIDENHPVVVQFVRDYPDLFQDVRLPRLGLTHCSTLHDGLLNLAQNHYDLVILNLFLPDSQGEATLTHFLRQIPALPFIVITPQNESALALLALKQGATDVLYEEELSLPLLRQALHQRGVLAPQSSRINFERLAEFSSDVILLFDAATYKITYYNRPLIFGYASYELAFASDLARIVHPDDQPAVSHYWSDVLRVPQSKEKPPLTWRLFNRDGQICWVEGRYWVFQRYEDGLPQQILVTLRDVTTQKQTSLALQQQATHLQMLVEISQTLRAAATVADMAPFILAQANLFAAAYSSLFLVENPSGDLLMIGYYPQTESFPPMRLAAGQGVVGHVIQTGESYITHDLATDPYVVITPDVGPLLDPLHTFLALPLRFADQLVGVYTLGFAEKRLFNEEEGQLFEAAAEIFGTALHRAKMMETWDQDLKARTAELAAANERLRELDLLKSKFIHDVSHELRTPISNLRLYADLLERGSVHKRSHYQSVIKKQTERLNLLLEDILSLSRLDLAQERPQFVPVHLNEIVADVVQAHQVQAESSNLTLAFWPTETLPPLLAEPNQLSQVTAHLLSNALKFTPQGSIRVLTALSPDNLHVCLEVVDSGIGIHEADIPHLFKRFYRGQQASQSAIAGTGLGLAIVWEIVHLHRGRVEVESQAGQGTTFRVWLPITS
jgi:signal transduction histidine kinase/CheY-like chemotaxis protein